MTIEHKFTKAFDRYACEGDTITGTFEGFEVTARIVRDDTPDAPDERQDGFWPSKDKKDPGYVSPEMYEAELEHATEVMRAWRNDEWFYCGIVLSISRAGVVLDRHAASLWGIECNCPKNPRAASKPEDFPNAYLTEVANELLDEALERGRAVLTKLFDDTGERYR